MKKNIFFLWGLIYFLIPGYLFPQVDSMLASKFIVDFAVPDEPAFKLLTVDQSNILRPATVRDFSVAISDFISPNGQFSIPANFGLEFSPGLLINGKNLTIADYQKQAAWYRLRISAATSTGQALNNGRKFAFGIRTSLIDESDLRTNTDFLNQQVFITRQINNIKVETRKAQGLNGDIILSDSSKTKIDSLKKQLDNLINEVKDSYSNSKWNSRFLDFAAGTYGMSTDSAGNNYSIQDISFWLTYADGFSTSWMQLLLGIKASNSLDSLLNERLYNASLACRLYMGNNNYKFFIEGQATGKEKYIPVWLLNFGSEANVFNAVWLEFSGGLNFLANNKPKLVTNFNIKLSLADFFRN